MKHRAKTTSEGRVNSEGTSFSPVSGMNRLVSGVRQVSWTEAA